MEWAGNGLGMRWECCLDQTGGTWSCGKSSGSRHLPSHRIPESGSTSDPNPSSFSQSIPIPIHPDSQHAWAPWILGIFQAHGMGLNRAVLGRKTGDRNCCPLELPWQDSPDPGQLPDFPGNPGKLPNSLLGNGAEPAGFGCFGWGQIRGQELLSLGANPSPGSPDPAGSFGRFIP